MRAAFYERNGAAREVLQLGDVPTPEPGAGEVRSAAERPSTPTTSYWRVKAYVKLPDAQPGARVEMLLPLSDVRQQIKRLGDGCNAVVMSPHG